MVAWEGQTSTHILAAATSFSENLKERQRRKEGVKNCVSGLGKTIYEKNNPYSGQLMKGIKKEDCMSFLQKTGHWKRNYRKKLPRMQ